MRAVRGDGPGKGVRAGALLLFPWIYSISNNKHTGVGAGGPHTTRLTGMQPVG